MFQYILDEKRRWMFKILDESQEPSNTDATCPLGCFFFPSLLMFISFFIWVKLPADPRRSITGTGVHCVVFVPDTKRSFSNGASSRVLGSKLSGAVKKTKKQKHLKKNLGFQEGFFVIHSHFFFLHEWFIPSDCSHQDKQVEFQDCLVTRQNFHFLSLAFFRPPPAGGLG